MNLTPPPPSQNCHVVRWHCTAESEWMLLKLKADFCYYYFFFTPGSI